MPDSRILNRTKPLIVGAIFVLGALLYSIAPSGASAGTTVTVGSGSAAPGATISVPVAVTLASGDTLNGFDVTVAFSPSVVTATGAPLGAGWVQGGNVTTTINNVSGSVRVQGFQLGSGCTSGSCPLFTLNFTAGPSGSTQATVSAQQLSGSNGGSLGQLTAVGSSSGTLSVNGGAPATNSPVSTATNTPVPPTNTPVPPTATSVPPTATSVPATTTTAPAATATTPAATNTPVSNPTQPAATPSAPQPQPTTGAVVVVPPSNPGSSGPDNPAPNPSVPQAPGGPTGSPVQPPSQAAPAPNNSGSSPAPSTGGNVDGRFIPLPPRTGNTRATDSSLPTREMGILLMTVSVALGGWMLANRRKPQPADYSRTIDRYLAGEEERGRKDRS